MDILWTWIWRISNLWLWMHPHHNDILALHDPKQGPQVKLVGWPLWISSSSWLIVRMTWNYQFFFCLYTKIVQTYWDVVLVAWDVVLVAWILHIHISNVTCFKIYKATFVGFMMGNVVKKDRQRDKSCINSFVYLELLRFRKKEPGHVMLAHFCCCLPPVSAALTFFLHICFFSALISFVHVLLQMCKHKIISLATACWRTCNCIVMNSTSSPGFTQMVWDNLDRILLTAQALWEEKHFIEIYTIQSNTLLFAHLAWRSNLLSVCRHVVLCCRIGCSWWGLCGTRSST